VNDFFALIILEDATGFLEFTALMAFVNLASLKGLRISRLIAGSIKSVLCRDSSIDDGERCAQTDGLLILL